MALADSALPWPVSKYMNCPPSGQRPSARAGEINARLAEAAQHLGIALAVGSQRAALERGGVDGLDGGLRRRAPDTPILANIGAAQLTRGFGLDEARRIMETIGADALILHLNPLQEGIQPEGDRDWRGVARGIERVAAAFPGRLIVKETGAGFRSIAEPMLDTTSQLAEVVIELKPTSGKYSCRIGSCGLISDCLSSVVISSKCGWSRA